LDIAARRDLSRTIAITYQPILASNHLYDGRFWWVKVYAFADACKGFVDIIKQQC
jgi:hypothetical protein